MNDIFGLLKDILTMFRFSLFLLAAMLFSTPWLHAGPQLNGEYGIVDIPDEKNFFQAWKNKTRKMAIQEFVPRG